MKKMVRDCPVCGKEYEYVDMRHIPPTCGRKMCVSNFDYAYRMRDPLTGKMPDVKKVAKL